MATFSKKLNMRNSAGTYQTALIYSTTGEAGSVYLNATVDGQAGYIPLVSTSDSAATSGRAIKSGTTYAIASSAVPPYGSTTMTTAGSGTFTVPSGVTKLRVTCVGGGAGGWDFYTSNTSSKTYNGGTGGGTTTFGTVSATGATQQTVTGRRAGSQNRAVVDSYTVSQGTTNGIYCFKDENKHAGASSVSLTNINGTTIVSAGAGGAVDHGYATVALTGGSGYKTVSTITVSPGQVISYSVGAGGKANMDTSVVSTDGYGGSGHYVWLGKAGAILVEWGKGVQ